METLKMSFQLHVEVESLWRPLPVTSAEPVGGMEATVSDPSCRNAFTPLFFLSFVSVFQSHTHTQATLEAEETH